MISAVTLSEPTQTLAALAAARKARLARIDAAANQHQAKLGQAQQQKDRLAQIAAFEFAMANMPRKPVVPPIPEPKVKLVIPPNLSLHILTIQGAVAEHFGITRVELVSRRRTKNVAEPRQIAMYLAKDLTRQSLPQIGRKFGWRDHTTVLHAVNKMRAEVLNGTEMGQAILKIRRELLA